jgi:hypothetical protein
MSAVEPPFTCANCHAEIPHEIVFHVGLAFCCAGCVADGPCTCSYDDPAPIERSRPLRAEAEPVADRRPLVDVAA